MRQSVDDQSAALGGGHGAGIGGQAEGFGNLFASEFVAADGNTYHLNFYLAYNIFKALLRWPMVFLSMKLTQHT